jgi:hypothetical protein
MSTTEQVSTRAQTSAPRPSAARAAAPGTSAPLGVENRIQAVQQLIAAMLIGEMNGRKEESESILKAVTEALGDDRQLRVSLSLASAMRGDAKPALDLLTENLDEWPNPDMARVALSMSLKVAGEPQWRDVPDRVLSVSTDESVRLFAQLVIST